MQNSPKQCVTIHTVVCIKCGHNNEPHQQLFGCLDITVVDMLCTLYVHMQGNLHTAD